jgi:glutaredoxin
MENKKPQLSGFTVYSKSGCPNCLKVKKLLDEKKKEYVVFNCDEQLIEDKEAFLNFIKTHTKRDYKFFPMVFFNGEFIGGCLDTIDYLDKIIDFNETF